MKLLSTFTALLLTTCISGTLSAQKVKLTEGDLSSLKGQTLVNIEFTYNDMAVGKFPKEQDYIIKKKDEYNAKEAGKGDKWAWAWVDDRQARYEPKFIELFELQSGMKVSSKKEAKYTIIFNTSFTEPGFNMGIARKNALINGEVVIVETANRNKVIAKLSIDKAPGRTFGGFDFDSGLRLSEAYEAAGKALGKTIKENTK